MSQKIRSFWLALWAGFLRLIHLDHPKETAVPNFYTPEELKEKLKDADFRRDMVDWVENTLRPLENDALYLTVCRDRRAGAYPVHTTCIQAILDRLEPYIVQGTPAHELGHHIFDALGGSALISHDPFIAKSWRNEIDAAFFAAMFHDCSTGIQHRYVDNEWSLSHAELAAWIFYHATAGLLIEPIRRLAAYAVAAHPHMLKEMTAKDGSVRKPWNDKLFYYGDRPVRAAVWITRWTDRLENGGDSATHLVRHTLAALDGARVGGMDLHSIDWYSFNDALKFLFTPKAVVTEVPALNQDGSAVLKDGQLVVNKVPSLLQHLKGYAASALAKPASPYNQHDRRSPVMGHLMGWKVANSAAIIETVTNTTGTPDFEIFVRLMKLKSGNPNTQMTLETIEMVRDLWNLNTSEDQAHWAHGFEFALASYYEWLTVLETQISQATDPTILAFQPLVPGLVARVTKI